MRNPEYLTIVIARELILQRFAGGPRVPRREIVLHVETAHCAGVRKLVENEKQIISDALRSLRDKGFADNSKHGWFIRDHNPSGTDSIVTTDPACPRKTISTHSDLFSEKTIGSGRSSVYLYYYQQYRDAAEAGGDKVWKCKIGSTRHSQPQTRIREQVGTALPEKPKIGLHIKTDAHEKIERIIHDILKVRGKHIAEAPGTEWFLTSPSEVEEIYKFILD